jgi:hypothetical protein
VTASVAAVGTVFVWVGAALLFVVILKVGVAMVRSLGTPLPPPPPPGEMRRVNLKYRCSICTAEVRMTTAVEELPDPPRHCGEDMDLIAPIE